MQIISASDSTAIPQALSALFRGELVIYPTETCYGIAADATNSEAVTRLLTFKGDRKRQVSVAVYNRATAERYVNVNPIASNLYNNFLPGPITVISESRHLVDERLESATGTLGIRIPKHDFALQLLHAFGKPITATSANTSGKKEPYSLSDWQKYTVSDKQKMVTLFLDAGKLEERPTSTVVDTTLNDPVVLRQGELVLPSTSPSFVSHSEEDTRHFAAGLMKKYLNLLRTSPILIALQGNLGAGKTQFGKGIAEALEIQETVASPTYTILHEYPYSLPKYSGTFYHLDTWRLSDINELETTLHLSKLLKPGNILALEWAGKAKYHVEKYQKEFPVLLIDMDELDENTRVIKYAFSTPDWS